MARQSDQDTRKRKLTLQNGPRAGPQPDFSDNRGNCEVLKARASRRSKKPFLAFSWWYFPPKHKQNPTKFNRIFVCYQFFSLKYERFHSGMKF